VRAEGARVWDSEGREFIDCIGAYSAVTHGHLGTEVVKAAKAQLDRVAVTSRAYYNAHVALFLKALCEYCDLDMACPMNS
ncbi:aminotransferase class III-fold pyridoxal phosphate-dependent enzyme, partial [Acinetobacter baumannii]